MTFTENRRRAVPLRVVVALAAAVSLIVMLATGITGLALLRDGSTKLDAPSTSDGLGNAAVEAERCLNRLGESLAGGRSDGLSVYSVKASLDTDNNRISADETVLFTNRTGKELHEVVFRVYANRSDIREPQQPAVTVRRARAGGAPAEVRLEGSLLTLGLPRALKAGQSVEISFSFTEYIPRVTVDPGGSRGGATTGGYGIYGHDRHTYNLGYWLPQIASHREGWDNREVPGFGDPSDFECALFDVSFEVPGDMVVAAPGNLIEEVSRGGRKRCRFVFGPARDFEVQAGRRYLGRAKTVGPTTVTSYFLDGSEEAGGRALDIACRALDHYSRRIGPYPYKKLNVCQAPMAGGAAGMEFSGQILIADALYGNGIPGLELPDEWEKAAERFQDLLDSAGLGLIQDSLEFVTAHEVCHQWFALVVGSDSIGHPWQDESLVNLSCAIWQPNRVRETIPLHTTPWGVVACTAMPPSFHAMTSGNFFLEPEGSLGDAELGDQFLVLAYQPL